MRTFHILALTAAITVPATLFVGCGDDGDEATGATGSTTNPTGNTTMGGGPPSSFTEVQGDITADTTWSADMNPLVVGTVRVLSGATLTIEAGTTVYGDPTSKGSLVIGQGGRIDAVGTADSPIVFTSPLDTPQAGDWGGLVILGRAPIVVDDAGTATNTIEGFTTDEVYGGSDAADNSGSLRYVRIEYSGVEISDGNEINGLTMGGVGSGTTIDHVMVRATLDDCFEWFGGTVSASHLVCYRNGDDGFDMDEGWQGSLQYGFVQQDPATADDTNGIEADSITDNSDPTKDTAPTMSNLTLCGQNASNAKNQFGMVLREGFRGTIDSSIVSGFEAGVSVRDVAEATTDPTISNSWFWMNDANEAGMDVLGDPDNAGSEAFVLEGTGNTTDMDPGLADCFATSPDPTAANATGAGAFVSGGLDLSEGWVSFN